ncbi:hypothetical protein D3C78_1434440 [compost metagenome]
MAVQGQLDDLRVLVGDGEQTVAVRIVGQRRDVIVEPFDGFGLDRHPIVRQPDGTIPPFGGVAPFLQAEQAPLEEPELLRDDAEHHQQQQQEGGKQPPRGQECTHRSGLGDSRCDEGYRAHSRST